MDDKEFKELEKKYYDEMARRNKVQKLKDKIGKYENAIKSITNAKTNNFESLSEITINFKVFGTIDGHQSYLNSSHEIEISCEEAISVLKNMIQNIKTQLEKEI